MVRPAEVVEHDEPVDVLRVDHLPVRARLQVEDEEHGVLAGAGPAVVLGMGGVLVEVLRDVAVRAAAAVGASFAGVDVLYDGDGRLTVLEVNSMPAWSGLQKVTSFDIAVALAGDVIAAAGERRMRGLGA